MPSAHYKCDSSFCTVTQRESKIFADFLEASPSRSRASGGRRHRRAASLTDHFQIRDVNIVERKELHSRLSGDACLLHSRREPVFLKLLKRLLRFPDVQDMEHARCEIRDVQDHGGPGVFVELQVANHLALFALLYNSQFP